MPIYCYRAVDQSQDCLTCSRGFEEIQKIADPPLERCPDCDAAVERVISAPFVHGGGSHLLEEKHFSKHGFTQYRKVEKGVYEKTGGKGPRYIADDGK